MKPKTKIFYWSPFLVPIATPKAVVNSAKALQNYGKGYECSIINFFGEFNKFQEDLKNKDIKLINFFNNKLINFLPKDPVPPVMSTTLSSSILYLNFYR